jgi:hypothetical protein
MHGRALLAFAVGIVGIVAIAAEGDDARYSRALEWKKERFSRVLALGYTDLGVNGRGVTEIRNLDGQSCLVGPAIGFDVDNAYAFDVDESVELTFTYVPELTKAEAMLVLFDRNAGDGRGVMELVPDRSGARASATVSLTRARLAGQGAQGVDLAIVGRQGAIGLCDVRIERSGATRAPAAFGQLKLDVRDAKTDRIIPARVGLYDETGRLPLPSNDAVAVRRFTDQIRRVWLNRRTFWPVESREAFYVGGSYSARVPSGTYDLVVSRGPEYRLHHQKLIVSPQGVSQIQVRLNRYDDLPARGWYSGESHLHLQRDQVADVEAWTQVAAEDLHVAHLLEMGNIMGTYFKQPAWGKAGRYQKDDVALVSGQEDPRTVARGHTIHWNVDRHAHFERGAFFQYHHVFERTRRGGAVTGYAHHGELFNGRRGLAIDVPFGLVDFIEVLQGGRIATETWYNLLNLGFRVLPVAGADWPYFGPTLPGVERTFVKVDGPFTVDSWLAGFRQGRAYVTNGPFLELSVNGRPMGAEVRVARGSIIQIDASAHLNPDVDALDRIELVVLGDAVRQEPARGQDRVRLQTTLTADRSFWLAIRAYGRHQETQFTTIAHSAPVYVVVGDEPTWKADALGALVKVQLGYLNDLLTEPVNADGDLEFFETRETILEEWKRQLPTLTLRVREAEARYRALLEQLRKLR